MYKNILVPLDGSELAECVLPHVEIIAKGCGVESVTFVRAVEPVHIPVSDDEGYAFSVQDWKRLQAELTTAAENYLQRVTRKIKYDGVKVQAQVLTGGQAADMIADYAAKAGADLIIIATHGRSGVGRWVLGSVADRVLRIASVPVLMVRAKADQCPPASGASSG